MDLLTLVAVAIWASGGLVVRRGAGPVRVHSSRVSSCYYFSFQFDMAKTVSVPFFDGEGESFANYAEQVELWNRKTHLDAVKRGSARVLHMGPVAREVRVAVGNIRRFDSDDVVRILQVLRDYLPSRSGGLDLPGSGPAFALQTHHPDLRRIFGPV